MSRRLRSEHRAVVMVPEYFARISRQRGGGYVIEFPDLPGCLTEGRTVPEALANAREALSGWIFVALTHGDALPPPGVYAGRTYHHVTPDFDVAVPLLILMARRRRGLTQHDVARALGITQQAYRKLEIPGVSNPTIATLGRLSQALDLRLTLTAA